MDKNDTCPSENLSNGISNSELDTNTDYCLTNLKILSRINVGDKLCYDTENKKFLIDEWTYAQPLFRWWAAEGRNTTVKSLESFINNVFKTIDNIYSNEIGEEGTYENVNNTYYTNVTRPKTIFQEANSTQLLTFITEMRNAIGGISNLKQTYKDDVSTVSSLDLVVEKLNVRVKKIQGILQIQSNSSRD